MELLTIRRLADATEVAAACSTDGRELWAAHCPDAAGLAEGEGLKKTIPNLSPRMIRNQRKERRSIMRETTKKLEKDSTSAGRLNAKSENSLWQEEHVMDLPGRISQLLAEGHVPIPTRWVDADRNAH